MVIIGLNLILHVVLSLSQKSFRVAQQHQSLCPVLFSHSFLLLSIKLLRCLTLTLLTAKTFIKFYLNFGAISRVLCLHRVRTRILYVHSIYIWKTTVVNSFKLQHVT